MIAARGALPQPRAQLVALLRSRVRMLSNGALRAGSERRGRSLVVAVLVAGAMLGSFRFAGVVLSVDAAGRAPLLRLVSGGLVVLCGFTMVTSVTFAISSLYFAKDLDGLLACPVPPATILLSRVYTQLGLGAALGALLGGPPLLAYALSRGAVLALPLVMVAVLGLVSLPLVAGTGLTIAAVRLMPARYVRDAGGLVVTVVVFATAALNLVLRGPEGFTSGRPGVLDFTRYGGGVAGAIWSPVGWTARACTDALEGHWGAALLWTAPLVLLGGVAPLALARLGGAAFLAGYQRNGTASRGARGRRRAGGAGRRGPAWHFWVLAAKDLREVRRDASQLGQLFLPLVLFGLYIAVPTGGGRGRDLGASGLPAWFGLSLTAAFASLFTASGVALRGVGGEGARMWMLKTAPVRPASVLAAKFLVGVVVSAALGSVLLWVGEARVHAGPVQVLADSARLLVIIAGLVGLATGMGALRPRLDWTDPRRAVGVAVGFVFLGLGATYLALAFVLLGIPLALHAGALGRGLADLAVLGLAAGVALTTMALGARRLRTLEV